MSLSSEKIGRLTVYSYALNTPLTSPFHTKQDIFAEYFNAKQELLDFARAKTEEASPGANYLIYECIERGPSRAAGDVKVIVELL